MASRRWMDWKVATRMLGGLALMALPALSWMGGTMTRGAWTLGFLGAGLFCWGLFSIGDVKNEWQNDLD